MVSTKMSGFTMEVINSDPNMVICGIRILLGSQDVARTPSFVEVTCIFNVICYKFMVLSLSVLFSFPCRLNKVLFSLQVYGRSTQTIVVRNRWFDIPLTREESLQSDKKLVINFGPSQDPDGVTMVDSVKVNIKHFCILFTHFI